MNIELLKQFVEISEALKNEFGAFGISEKDCM